MTKVTILGEQPQKPKKKPIEFKKILNSELVIKNIDSRDYPKNFNNIELISKKYAKGLDLMFAYKDDRNSFYDAVLCLGHFNDGIV